MPVPTTERPAAMSALAWECLFDGVTLGLCRDVDPSGLEVLTRSKASGLYDEVELDQEIYGLKGEIKAVLEEVDADRMRQVMPWAASTGAFPLVPGSGAFSMYANAKPLVLHPKGLAVKTSDISVLKAFPVVKFPAGGGGQKWKLLPVSFRVFVEHEALFDPTTSTRAFGYIGEPPAEE